MGIAKRYFGSISKAKRLFKKQTSKDFPSLSFITTLFYYPSKDQALSNQAPLPPSKILSVK